MLFFLSHTLYINGDIGDNMGFLRLAKGHFDMWSRKAIDWTTNPLTGRWPLFILSYSCPRKVLHYRLQDTVGLDTNGALTREICKAKDCSRQKHCRNGTPSKNTHENELFQVKLACRKLNTGMNCRLSAKDHIQTFFLFFLFLTDVWNSFYKYDDVRHIMRYINYSIE